MVLDPMEVWAASLRDSDYEGWVAYVDSSPIFEAAPHDPRLAQAIHGARTLPHRRVARNTLDWKDLPHERVHRLEVYFCRQSFPRQPVVRIDRMPGQVLRWIQLKMGGLVLNAGAGIREPFGAGVQRLGIVGYRIGWWNPAARECRLLEVTPRGVKDLGTRQHPCEPAPRGFGLAPHVVGLETAPT